MDNEFLRDKVSQIKEILVKARNILIGIPKNPDLDTVAAALSLYLALTRLKKNVFLISPSEMTVEFNRLVGVDKISQKFHPNPGRNLIISFPYEEGSIEKVSYNIENGKFNLVIESRKGYQAVTPKDISFKQEGEGIDTIITFNTKSLSDLGEIYQRNSSLFQEAPIIQFSSQTSESEYGQIKVLSEDISSVSEIVFHLLSQLGWEIDSDIASNLFAGISAGSKNFTSPKTSATTFEAAAICLRHNAKRLFPGEEKKEITFPRFSPKISQSFSFKPQAPTKKETPKETPQKIKTFPPKSFSATFFPAKKSAKTAEETPADWLKPKIYKGSNLL